MAAAKDIAISENDYLFANGDFSIVDSDSQHIEDLIFENIGAYKQFPLAGTGIINYLNSSDANLKLKKEIQTQLVTDGYRVDAIIINSLESLDLTVDAIRS